MAYAPIPMVPGPVTVHPDVLLAMNKDFGSGQIDEQFLPLYHATGRNLARILGTANDVVLMSGEGMLALWAGLKSCLQAGDAVVSVGTGVFGDGIGDMAASFGCRVERISLPYNSTIDDLSLVEDAIRRVKPVMLTAVHCETPSGTLNPLAALGQLKKDLHVPLFYADVVASAGGAPVKADAWHIDLALGGSQKCLSAPPSMSFLSVSPAAWDRIRHVGYQGYDAILPFHSVQTDGRCPYTPYWNGVAALYAASQCLLAEGLDAVFARHERVAARCREGLSRMGLELWTAPQAVNSPTVTAVCNPHGFTWPEWQKQLARRGLVVAGSFGPMAGRVFRLGHMGTQASMPLMEQALEAIADALAHRDAL